MIRIDTERKSLDADDPVQAAAAYEAGWRIDEDGWWVRPVRPTDINAALNQTYVVNRHAFVDSADRALAFDQGRAA